MTLPLRRLLNSHFGKLKLIIMIRKSLTKLFLLLFNLFYQSVLMVFREFKFDQRQGGRGVGRGCAKFPKSTKGLVNGKPPTCVRPCKVVTPLLENQQADTTKPQLYHFLKKWDTLYICKLDNCLGDKVTIPLGRLVG